MRSGIYSLAPVVGEPRAIVQIRVVSMLEGRPIVRGQGLVLAGLSCRSTIANYGGPQWPGTREDKASWPDAIEIDRNAVILADDAPVHIMLRSFEPFGRPALHAEILVTAVPASCLMPPAGEPYARSTGPDTSLLAWDA